MATGTGNLPYPMSPVSPFDVITSQAENERIANIESLADGTGIGDKSVTADKIDFATFADYTLSEINTGIKWVDGKTIYKKTINFGALPNSTVKGVAHGISNIYKVTGIEGIANNSTGGRIPLPYISLGSASATTTVEGANVVVQTGSAALIAYMAYITIYYTKV